MGLLALIALVLLGCTVIGFVAAMQALSRLRELRENQLRQGDRLAEIERQVSWLRKTASSPSATAEPSPARPTAGLPPVPVVDEAVPSKGAGIQSPSPPPLAPARVPPTEREWAEAASRLRTQGSGARLAQDSELAPAAAGSKPAWLENFDWENLVGVKLFSWIAGIALTLAAVFFLRYSIQNGWLQPPVQMAIGLFVGIVLLAVCEMKVAGNYRVTADAMDGSGIAILFATFFAAYARWHLAGIAPVFVGLALVTAIAVVLSVRRDSLFIAGLGLIGGFLTPFLLSTGQDNPLGLFGYLLVLNAGLAWVAYRKRWPWLTSASVALTTLYQWGWVFSFMRPDRIPLGASIFLVFPVLSAVALALNQDQVDGADGRVFAGTSDVSAVLPVLFAVYLVATPGYADQMAFAFGFLFCLCAGLFVLAIARRQHLLHLVGGASAFVIVNAYLDTSYQSGAWPGVVVWISTFVVLYLAAEWIAAAAHRPLATAGVGGTFAAPLLLFALAQLPAMEPITRTPWLLFGVAFALACAIAVVEFRFERRWLRMAGASMVALILFAWLGAHQRPNLAIGLAGAWAAIAVASAQLAAAGGRAKAKPLPDASVFVALLTAELVTMFAGLVWSANVPLLTAGHAVFLAALLWIATTRGWYRLVPALVAPGALAILFWFGSQPSPAPWQSELMLAAGIYAVFYVFPLVVERRAARVDEPWLAAVLASAVFFLAARDSLTKAGLDPAIGLLPLAQAALTGVLLWRLLKLEPAGSRRGGRVALVAGTLLAFITVSVPLQLEKQWITIGWALEAAALAWLYRRIPHRGLLATCLVLLVAVFGRLTLNTDLLRYHELGSRIFNWYLYTYLVAASSMFAAGWFLETTDDAPLGGVPNLPRGSTMAKAGGIALLFALVNIEIADFYSVGPNLSFNFSATLAQDLTYTLAWAAFGVALLVAGIVSRSHAARIGALVLLVATVLKGFLHDLARLGGLYRVFSFVGLAVCLSLVAVVLQKFVLRRPGEAVTDPVDRGP